MPLADNHVHLQDDRFASDLEAVLARASSAGVALLACNGTSEADWPGVLELARRDSRIVPSFGLHPWYVSQRTDRWLTSLRDHLLQVPSAVGEIGLDRWLEERDEAAQHEVFLAQLRVARDLERPVSIHCVKAWGWLAEIIESQPLLPCRFLLHAYGGSAELLKTFERKGGFFSFAGSVLRTGRTRQQEALRQVPLNRLLLETDAPDIPPPKRFFPFPGPSEDRAPRNEPANLQAITQGVAQLLGMPVADLEQQLWDNALSFWGHLPRTETPS